MATLNETLLKRPWLIDKPDETLRVLVGVDLGQMRDPTAIVVTEAQAKDSSRKEVADRLPDGTVWERPVMGTVFVVRHVERLPLRTPYRRVGRRVGDIVENLKAIAEERKKALRVQVLADATGLGRPVVEEMREELGTGVPISAVTITVGEKIVGGLGSPEVRVPKMILVSRLAALLQRGAIELPETDEARLLADELKTFQVRARTRGLQAEAMSGFHDDLVIALGLATLFDSHLRKVRRSRSIWR